MTAEQTRQAAVDLQMECDAIEAAVVTIEAALESSAAIARQIEMAAMNSAEQLLERLAALWVERWLKHGGGLIANPEGDSLQISMRLDWRRRAQPSAPAWHRRDVRWHDGWIVGRWRELSDLCNLVPGLRQAIIHHVELYGEPRVGGSRVMHARAEQVAAARPWPS